MADALAKKLNIRKVLKNIIATTLQESQACLNEDAISSMFLGYPARKFAYTFSHIKKYIFHKYQCIF